ncbi:hypothetical protein SOV92_15480 [Pectobacterium brasiliense]|uniref:DUF1761 domain-containing protein n=1 Tax=Pectobacterium brasiliense TaxID=180957 RepID=A0AAW9H6K9_9GAMM|nr:MULTISPECIES: hypothetical protein [Pectobacterium]AFR02129.1 hypothetical protein PCC21_007260 [Pectobacterium carotovorum subsp. carotovorum PCC21]KHT04398.1 hypothetical protein RC91_08520 [Pectobacterium brasiliense]MBN3066856.1 hypothetical protein [Pectobacterium brasiliense]MBN3097890.1 hypothetical protein [Pectobacterium brasiliense]MBN3116760.1 hypothetical protein [Pectobacterium brasiliense]
MSHLLVYAIIYVIFIAVVGLFAFQAWLPSSAPRGLRDRAGILVGVLRCVTLFLIVSALQILFPNSLLDKLVWLVAVAMLVIAVIGGGMSWSSLPWLDETKGKSRTLVLGVQSALYLALLGFIVI